MSVHFRGKCYVGANVECERPISTHWRKSQPNLVCQGYASEIIIKEGGLISII